MRTFSWATLYLGNFVVDITLSNVACIIPLVVTLVMYASVTRGKGTCMSDKVTARIVEQIDIMYFHFIEF